MLIWPVIGPSFGMSKKRKKIKKTQPLRKKNPPQAVTLLAARTAQNETSPSPGGKYWIKTVALIFLGISLLFLVAGSLESNSEDIWRITGPLIVTLVTTIGVMLRWPDH